MFSKYTKKNETNQRVSINKVSKYHIKYSQISKFQFNYFLINEVLLVFIEALFFKLKTNLY